jgi:hypothetical protein
MAALVGSGAGVRRSHDCLEPLETGSRPQSFRVVVHLERWHRIRECDPRQVGPREDVDVGHDARGLVERAAADEPHLGTRVLAVDRPGRSDSGRSSGPRRSRAQVSFRPARRGARSSSLVRSGGRVPSSPPVFPSRWRPRRRCGSECRRRRARRPRRAGCRRQSRSAA